jgi:hypothetical protein
VVVRIRDHDLLRLRDDPHEHRLRLGECPVSRSLTGLSAATTYHYRLVAKNASGTANGGDGLFTTASPPVVVTSPATGVGPTTATLGGTVDPNGEPTSWFVEYGTSTSYGSKSATADAGSGTAAKAVSVAVTGLTAGKTYHFRLVGTSSAGPSTARMRRS